MSDFLTLDKSTYLMGEPIEATYDLSIDIRYFGQVQIAIVSQASIHQVIQALPASAGPQSATFKFTQASQLSPGDYQLVALMFGQQELLASFSVTWSEGWTEIGTGIGGLVIAQHDKVYGISDANGDVMAYQGAADQWASISGAVRALAGNDDALYAIDAAGDVVLYSDDGWKPVGGGKPVLVSLVAAGEQLYGLDAEGEVFGFDGATWVDLQVRCAKLVANRSRVFALTAGQDQVLMNQDDQPQWISVGGAMTDLIAADNALYGIDGSGHLTRWTGDPTVWETLGMAGSNVVAGGATVLDIAPDLSAVYTWSEDSGAWLQVLGAADSVVIGDHFIYGTRGQSVLLYEYDGELPAFSDEKPPGGSDELASPVTSGADWIWTFQTLDEVRAGYDGHVQLSLFLGQSIADMTLPITSFSRGGTYVFPMTIRMDDLTSISLRGEDNFFGETWHVGTVTGYHIPTGRLFTFTFNDQIPNRGSMNRAPVSVQTGTPSPGASTVRIWTRGEFSPWGHAALTLSDGTHISWWPQGVDRKRMPFLPDVYSVAAEPDQTFDDDMMLECDPRDPLCVNGLRPPDVNIALWRLDEARIKAWWTAFAADPANRWATLSQNCSTTVWNALVAGGGLALLTNRQQDNYQAVIVWMPENVLQLATDILAAP